MEWSPVLLDTHFWLWLQAGDRRKFTARAARMVEQAAHRSGLLISIISIWEVGVLQAKGRVKLNADVDSWVREALKIPGLQLLPLTPEIALASSRLPGNLHGDPADRIIAATSRDHGARLLTRDEALLEYGRQRFIDLVEP